MSCPYLSAPLARSVVGPVISSGRFRRWDLRSHMCIVLPLLISARPAMSLIIAGLLTPSWNDWRQDQGLGAGQS
jgi:hypothetical protein